MALGTLSLTNGSVNVTGGGTKFTEYAEGSFITLAILGVPYTIAVDKVTNDTTMTLVVAFDGPTVSGIAFDVTGVNTMALATMGVTTQAQRALRMLLADQSNWRQIFSDSETITITLPNGQQLTGMSWGYISQQLADLDFDEMVAMRDEMRLLDASAKQSSQDAATAQGKAETAQSGAETALSTAQQVLADTEAAKLAAETAKSGADAAASSAAGSASTASSEADRAEAAADSIDTTNLLKKDQNLADLEDIAEGRNNLDVYSRAEIDAKPSGGGYIGQSWWHDMRSKMPDGCVASDGQEVDQAGPFADLYADVAAGNRPTCTEAEWQADPTKRNCYVLNSSTGKMRLPDRNGVQTGSIKAPVMRGDSGTLTAGSVQKGGVPNVAGAFNGTSSTTNPIYADALVTPPFKVLPRLPTSMPLAPAARDDAVAGRPLGIDLSTSSDAYVPGLTEVRANSIVGCYVIRYAGRAQNAGSLDAMTLSARMESINTDLLAKSVATNARIGYAIISISGTPALGSGQVLANPFGNNTPVICEVQAFHSALNKWITIEWQWFTDAKISGARCFYSEGEGLIFKMAPNSVVERSDVSGFTAGSTSTAGISTPTSIRVHVRKVTA